MFPTPPKNTTKNEEYHHSPLFSNNYLLTIFLFYIKNKPQNYDVHTFISNKILLTRDNSLHKIKI